MSTVELKSIVRNLPCALTRDELLDRADELSSTVQQIAVEEDRASNIKSQLKASMAELEARSSKLAAIVRSREEQRDIECRQTLDAEHGMVSVWRVDTGAEVERRKATPAELQQALPLETVPA